MGLTNQSTGTGALKEMFNVKIDSQKDIVIALAGNPNTGKSTVFNNLTGLNQHTGNWPGKTVTNAQGNYMYKNNKYILVDLPGTYSLLANSVEEEVARDFICFGKPSVTIVVTDATCLERNLNLVLQILEITNKVILCVNLLDEAARKKIRIDLKSLSDLLGVPVVGTCARTSKGLNELMDTAHRFTYDKIHVKPNNVKYNTHIEKAIGVIEAFISKRIDKSINSRWAALRLIEGDTRIINTLNDYTELNLLNNEELNAIIKVSQEILKKNNIDIDTLRDEIVSTIVQKAEMLANKTIALQKNNYNQTDRNIDAILTSKTLGIPIMIALLGVVFWITIQGANYPSGLLTKLFGLIENVLTIFFINFNIPDWIIGILIDGIYKTLAWVVSVMLPPMAIFFPLFTLLEDLGYLPRIAFNLDNFFKKACAHGKQALTMCMGFGCNAAGVIACRIIDSPRERLIATITNNFVPCNGRFPILITISMIFMGSSGIFSSIKSTLIVTGIIILGVYITLIVSKLLSKTVLKGFPSSFTLELPPYRKPQIGKIIVRSIFDRTLFVLGRAIVVAAPAGLVIWVMANIHINGLTLLTHSADFLDPFAKIIGLDGYILMAFILGFPANEIVIPIIIMSYMATGSIVEINNLEALKILLTDNGWTWLTAINVMIFTLLHFPCGTTLLTIRKETQSIKWSIISFILPTIVGIALCFTITQVIRLVR
jgi:ferrous iron transport protein B